MKESSNKMPTSPKKDKEAFTSFTQEKWEKWIWERTHGIDTITCISVIRDPNPHHALIDAYRTLANQEERQTFVDALMTSLNRSLDKCKNYFKVEDAKPELEDELFALERHLQILNRLDDEDIPSRAKRTCRNCYDFVYKEPLPYRYGSLRRITLAVRSRVGDRISDADLREGLNSNETYVVAFRHALKKYNSLAISKFFPQFVKMALESQKIVAIKVDFSLTVTIPLVGLSHCFFVQIFQNSQICGATGLTEIY